MHPVRAYPALTEDALELVHFYKARPVGRLAAGKLSASDGPVELAFLCEAPRYRDMDRDLRSVKLPEHVEVKVSVETWHYDRLTRKKMNVPPRLVPIEFDEAVKHRYSRSGT
ncbi:MAG: hypothetical protein ACJ8AS_08250 [Hyphomicrobiales bacterium]